MVEAPGHAEDDPDVSDDAVTETAAAVEEHERRAAELKDTAGELKAAWEDTIADMRAIAEEWREEGYEVTDIVAVDAGPIGRDSNDEDGEYGMEFVIPDDDADEFVEAFEAGEYGQYDVYRGEVQADAFIVEELVDHEVERVILLAGAYHLRDTKMAAWAAREEGETFTFVRTLDKTRLGTFRHEGYEKFFPRADDLPEDPMDFELV
ncbi:DUF7529 family protein [Halobacterium rubrum]|uniref:DUF7529 family protein n=1 Tax=Halobacterium TaxID=2239 RepID=UPI001F22EDC3|nr:MULTISPECIES: hypothetical protein [Halobacterium]MDH5018804.1 hypothetical protein [Halobacterium rubrum]